MRPMEKYGRLSEADRLETGDRIKNGQTHAAPRADDLERHPNQPLGFPVVHYCTPAIDTRRVPDGENLRQRSS